jgi:sulfatase modifying factor 1
MGDRMNSYQTLLFLLITLLIALLTQACSFDDQIAPSLNKKRTYFVSGRIIGHGVNVIGIEVSDGTHAVITDSDGTFTLVNISAGTYALVATKQNLRIDPLVNIVNVTTNNVINNNFNAYSYPIVEMTTIEASEFLMGSNNGNTDEKPPHIVTLHNYEIGKYEITQDEWIAVMNSNPSVFLGKDNPVDRISWYDAVAFCNALSMREGLDAAYTIDGTNVVCNFFSHGYRLPTEAEWEYACRAGTVTDRYSGNISSVSTASFRERNLDTIAWYRFNSDSTTHPVGKLEPNSFGLYDMQGNVTEWCWDYWNAYSPLAQTNPTGPANGITRSLRGGSWYDKPWEIRSAFHRTYSPSTTYSGVGFRVARSL